MKKPLILLFLLPLMSFWLIPQDKIKVYLVGDSTMADKEVKAYPETGWGMPFAFFFDGTEIVLADIRSLKLELAEHIPAGTNKSNVNNAAK